MNTTKMKQDHDDMVQTDLIAAPRLVNEEVPINPLQHQHQKQVYQQNKLKQYQFLRINKEKANAQS